MAVFDQFETEPCSSHSGSYNDAVLYRDMLDTREKFKREVIGYKTSGITPRIENKKILYSHVLSLVSGSGLRSTCTVAQHISNETYFDSYGPNIAKIYKKNVFFVASMTGLGNGINRPFTGDPDFNIDNINVDAAFFIILSKSPWEATTGTGTGPYVDTIWPYTFPFQGRYRDIERILVPGAKLIEKIDPEIGLVLQPTAEDRIDVVGGVMFFRGMIPGSQPSAVPAIHYVMDVALDTTNSIGSIEKGGNETSGSNATVKFDQSIRPNIETIQKTMFCFGNGVQIMSGTGNSTDGSRFVELKGKVPSFKDFFDGSVSAIQGTGGGVYLFQPEARGVKYGMINPNPIKSKTIFRKGKFGQFRDMLEQRPFTKFIERNIFANNTVTTDAAVYISFVDGTVVHSASRAEISTKDSSTDFNPTDSGQFNFEYRSGQPYFDDVNIENARNF